MAMPAIFEMWRARGCPDPGAEIVNYGSSVERLSFGRRDRAAAHLRGGAALLAANPPRPLQPSGRRRRQESRGPCAGLGACSAVAGVAVGVMSEILVGLDLRDGESRRA
jgi:hypothetical protein